MKGERGSVKEGCQEGGSVIWDLNSDVFFRNNVQFWSEK